MKLSIFAEVAFLLALKGIDTRHWIFMWKSPFNFGFHTKGTPDALHRQMLKLPSGDKYSYKGGIYLSEMSIPVRKAEHCFGSESMIFSLICRDAQTTTYFPLLPVIKHSRWWKKVAWGGATYSLHKCRVITWWNLMFIASLWVTLWVGGASMARTSLIFHTFSSCIITLGFSVRQLNRHCYN